MDSKEKIQKLNTLAETLRVTVKNIADLYEKDADIQHFVWRINKQISLIYQKICGNLEKEITDEDFKNIVKQIEKDLGDFHE